MRELNRVQWPHKVIISTGPDHEVAPIEQWLRSDVGQVTREWNVVYLYRETHYYFRNNEHAVWFALRWT